MEIRKLETEEKQNTKKLYEEVFSEDSKSFVDYYYEEKLKDNQIYAVEEDGEIQAMLHLNPYELAVNGSKKDVNYIVAVATRESYRKRGYMAGLLKQALNDMYADGETFTFLMPASESIYLPFDFRTVCEQNRSYYDPGGGNRRRRGHNGCSECGCRRDGGLYGSTTGTVISGLCKTKHSVL